MQNFLVRTDSVINSTFFTDFDVNHWADDKICDWTEADPTSLPTHHLVTTNSITSIKLMKDRRKITIHSRLAIHFQTFIFLEIENHRNSISYNKAQYFWDWQLNNCHKKQDEEDSLQLQRFPNLPSMEVQYSPSGLWLETKRSIIQCH